MPVEQLSSNFPPEFINRINEVVQFEPLQQQGIKLDVTDSATSWLSNTGYDPQYGARPLARLIKKEILNPTSKLILGGEAMNGSTLHVDVAGDELQLHLSQSNEPDASDTK